MPRMGLTPEKVVAAAAALADQVGINDLSLSALAAQLGVRVPSLYKHVGGLQDLRHRLAVQGANGLAAAVESAARGEHGRDALLAIGGAYRRYARANHGCYQAMAREPAKYARRGGPVNVALRRTAVEHGLAIADAPQAADAVRSALHGFVVLEAGGGFGVADADASFHALLVLLERGLDPVPDAGAVELRLPALDLAAH
ncbi:MAG: TetR family transcriptional regulator [Pseudonocardiales bacterium]|nr:MAG: TetR family transcriptional regulator [Pseudonocardiales bacterium]